MCTVGLCGLGVVPIVTGSFLGGTSRPGCNESLAWFPVCLFVPSLGWSPSKLLPQALPCWGPWPGSASCPPSSHLLRCRKPDHTWHWGCTSRPGQRAPVRWLCRARLLVRRPPGHTAPRCGHTAAGASPDAAGGGASYFGGGVKPGRAGRWRFSPEKSQRAQPRSGGARAIGWHSQGDPVWRREDRVSARPGQGPPGRCVFWPQPLGPPLSPEVPGDPLPCQGAQLRTPRTQTA